MKIVVKNDIVLQKALKISQNYFEYFGQEVEVLPVKNNILGYTITKTDNGFTVEYGSTADFFHAVGIIASNETIIDTVYSKPYFKRMGVMVDCARNGVANVEWLKRFIVTIAFSGYNYLGLYLEDCLEVDGEPLMGYMRGRFTKAEIQEIVDFAENFGVEIIPYMQTLAHLERLFHHWIPYIEEMKDVFNIILIDEPRTYVFIENVVKTCAEYFKSKKIHIGMDEAPLMMRGAYQDKHGYVDKAEVFSRHIGKICDICQKYGLEPIAWADMFEQYGKDGKLSLPDNLTLNSWSYYSKLEKEYSDKIALSKKLTSKVSFASGVWSWVGYAPLNEYSLLTSLPSVRAVKKATLEDFCVTTWGDDGAECPRSSTLGALFAISNYANEVKLNKIELSKLSKFLTGYSIKDLFALDLPNKVFDCKFDLSINVSKYVLFLDLFMGLRDKSENAVWCKYFARNKKKLLVLSKRKSEYAYIYKLFAALCAVNELKCGVFKELRESYKQHNLESVKKIRDKIPKIIKKAIIFKDLQEQAWLKENKPFGLEIQSIRLGGLITRLEYVKRTLDKYINGEINSIAELEQQDLSEPLKNDKYNGAAGFNSYEQNVSYSCISYRPLA